MRLIGINGRLRSGKDTAFEIIKKACEHPDDPGLFRVEREAFADRLKQSAAAALGVPAEDALAFCNMLKTEGTITVNLDSIGSFEVSGREYLQWYGTEAHREVFGDSFWIDALLPISNEHPSRDTREISNKIVREQRFPGVDVLVITDVRFTNEATRILRLGGEVWKIEADKRLGPLPADAHPSEHPLPDAFVTHVVPNNGTLEEFERNVREALA